MANLTEAQLRTLIQGITPSVGRRVPTLSACDPESWLAWSTTWENVVKLRGWDAAGQEETRIKNFVAALEGPAARAVAHIDPAHDPDHANNAYTYDDLKAAYQRVFLPPAASHLALTQYNVARQQDQEALLAYHTRMRELFSRAYPNKTAQTDTELINRFILGLQHPQVRDRTWDAHPETYSEALSVATSKAAGVLVMQATGGGRRAGGVGALGVGDLQVAGSGGAAAVVAGVDGAGARRRGGDNTCYNCGSPDHFKRDCPSLPEGAGARRGRGRRGQGGRGGRSFPPTGRGGRRDGNGRFTAKGVNALADLLEGLSMEEESAGSGN